VARTGSATGVVVPTEDVVTGPVVELVLLRSGRRAVVVPGVVDREVEGESIGVVRPGWPRPPDPEPLVPAAVDGAPLVRADEVLRRPPDAEWSVPPPPTSTWRSANASRTPTRQPPTTAAATDRRRRVGRVR